MKPKTTIEGSVERIVYCNAENAWSVVRLAVRGRGQVTVVGNLLGVQPGESLHLLCEGCCPACSSEAVAAV